MRDLEQIYIDLLKKELKPALGCTEPIAIAFTAAKARAVLASPAKQIKVYSSRNIIKNVAAVVVPNSNGARGIRASAILGFIAGDASLDLEVLKAVSPADIKELNRLLASDFCESHPLDTKHNLHIRVEAESESQKAVVEVKDSHTNVSLIEIDGQVIYEESQQKQEECGLRSHLDLKSILKFAKTVNLAKLDQDLERQIRFNLRIAEAGLQDDYGVQVGKTLLSAYDAKDVRIKARALAAAGSDARMSGCPLPVVINSGSGNQGMTASLPLIAYARHFNVANQDLKRALICSNLISLLQKKDIGDLSAYCGVVSAAAGAAAGIVFMQGGGYEEISMVLTNTLANIGGMLCDGAKASCAAKISSALEAAFLSIELMQKKLAFQPGEGLVKATCEETLKAIGRVAAEGMAGTDLLILDIILEE